ncbi:MAG: tetratricopeptide repeat protein [Deltaproteobacteria bacterium]|nr:tetratricopeptide repeat protein [Deltaproteobacteria bacterium]
MTLIISCLTEDYAIQVSDRRLTYPNGKIADDNANKVVDWGGWVAFGYTGLAEILSKPTDQWLSEALLINTPLHGGISLDEAIESARVKATRDFKRIPGQDKRFTTVGVGWAQMLDTNESKPQLIDFNRIKPTMYWISNCLDDEGNTMAKPYEEFKANSIIFNIPPHNFVVKAIGQPISHNISVQLYRNIARCVKQRGIGPEPITRFLIETIRDVAEENITVGRNVMVACIPKESLRRNIIPMSDGSRGFYVSSSKPQKFDRTFLYVPDGQDEGNEEGTNFVLGGSWLRGFRVERGENKSLGKVSWEPMRIEPGATQGTIFFEDGTFAHFISPPQKMVIDEYEQVISNIDKTFASSNRINHANDLIDGVIYELNKLIELNKENHQNYVKRSIYYQKLGKYDEALIDANKAISLAPQSDKGFVKRGFVFIEINKFDEAKDDFDTAIGINPNCAKAYCGMGSIYGHKSQYDSAITNLKRALLLDNELCAAYGNLGSIYMLKGDYDSAILEYDKALTLNDELNQFHKVYFGRGLTYLKKRSYIKAINDFNEAITLDLSNSLYFHNRGIACHKIGKLDLAIRDQNKAIELNPIFAEAFDFRGVAYSLTGELGQAISDFNEAIKLKPDYCQAYNNRGLLYFNADDLDKALADFNMSLSLKPNMEAYYNRAGLFLKKKEFENAKKDFKEALKFENDPAFHKKIINKIKAIDEYNYAFDFI